MPIYEYRCAECDGRFEILVSKPGDTAPRCPRCGAARAERLISTFAVSKPGSDRPPGPCGSSECACRTS